MPEILDFIFRTRKEGRGDQETAEGLKQVKQGTSEAAKGFDLLKTAGGYITGGAIAAAVVNLGRASIEAASDVDEMSSKFRTVFKDQAPATEKALTELAGTINRSRYDLMGYAATLQDTFVPLGFARDKAAEMSIQLVALAEDLASFNNLNTADVMNDLQSAMVGNTEGLRKYGVVASQAAIDAKALEMGLWNGKGAMDAQTKAMATLQLTLEGTTDAQGDAARTADGLANQQRAAEAATGELAVSIGTKLVPAAVEATQWYIALVQAATEWVNLTETNKASWEEQRIAAMRAAESYEAYRAQVEALAEATGTKLVQSQQEYDAVLAGSLISGGGYTNILIDQERVIYNAVRATEEYGDRLDETERMLRLTEATTRDVDAATTDLTGSQDIATKAYREAISALKDHNLEEAQRIQLEQTIKILSGEVTLEDLDRKRAIDEVTTALLNGKITQSEYITLLKQIAEGAGTAADKLDAVRDSINKIPEYKKVVVEYNTIQRTINAGSTDIGAEPDGGAPAPTPSQGGGSGSGSSGGGSGAPVNRDANPGRPQALGGTLFAGGTTIINDSPLTRPEVVVVDHASGGGQVLTQQQAMAALVGGQQRGDSYYISVDARGATDVAAVEKAGERGALRAIEELLRRQDVRLIRRS
ncbi:MAG TPA: hypothetical protein PL117_03230 [Accumulibacter sp.]|uniref:hypothetical protein n=1 Tax=Accumulibacter sp. TaxID=2053492 RepID=UPI002BF9C3FB|nr:hypothetical protein [Accumulibacter sp.]HRF71760.1 hypothetical protein [Accumulibacter sp.]